jgi:UDP-glucose 4-epimerase
MLHRARQPEGAGVRVVVTGSAGFIGGNLVRRLAADPGIEAVSAVDDLSTGSRVNVPHDASVRFVEGSILDASLLGRTLDGCDAVVHLAARPSVPRSIKDPSATHEVNATGTLRLLEAVRRAGNPHLVVASSSSVYGANPTLPKSEDLATAPLSPYAVSKLATESYALAYQECFNVPVLAFRFFNVFGPLQPAGHAYAAVVPTFIAAALGRRPLPVHGDGLQTRDFTYVGSVVSVLVEAVKRRVVHPAPVNLAFGSRRTVLDLIAALQAIMGQDLAVEHQPPRPGDVRHSQADQARLRSLFPGIEPVEFTQGLRETVEWFRSFD